MTKAKAKKKAHVVMIGAGVGCLNCGREQAIAYPISVSCLDGLARAFEKEHRHCEPSEAGTARFRYATPDEWLASWDTGISSKTIFFVLANRHPGGEGFKPGVPHDPSDFGRCYRLLKAIPAWRARLNEVAKRFPEWRPLVARWSDLEKLYEEEEPIGAAPKLYELMHVLLGEPL